MRRWLGLADELERGGIRHHDLLVHHHDVVDHHDDRPQENGASPQAGGSQGFAGGHDDDPHDGRPACDDLGCATHHDFGSRADDHAAGAGRRAPEDDEHPEDQHHQHRPAGLYQHPAGVLAAPGPPFVLVAGPPGSGKSSLAASLAGELGLPLLAKDEIKEALMGVLGPPATIEDSRRLGRAAVMAMLALAKSAPGAVLDSTFYPYTVPHLEQLPGTLVELRCRIPREVAQQRYRARSATRHVGHLDDDRPPEELWNEHHLTPLGLGPVLEVDTTQAVDVGRLAEQIRALAA